MKFITISNARSQLLSQILKLPVIMMILFRLALVSFMSWLGKMAKSLFIFLFFLIWTYYTRKLSQMATYWFVIDDLSIQRAQKSEVRQVANDVVKSKV